jgi:hypothetical protein
MRTRRRGAIRTGVITVAAAMAVVTGFTPAVASGSAPAVHYSFRTLDNAKDPTFNQLHGINNHGRIAGFYGSGAPGHPNKGYQLSKPYGQADYHPEHFPGSAQTQVAGLNDNGVSVGIYADSSGARFGFYLQNGAYHKVTFPTSNNSTPPFNELLGINDSGTAVGDFEDASFTMHAYRLNINTHRFTRINIKSSADVTATGINGAGAIVGFFTTSTGRVVSFLRHANGKVITFARAGASMTQAYGINDGGLVVGTYTSGSNTFGFTWTPGHLRPVNDPGGVGSTFINGVNNAGDLVGYYTDSRGNLNGLLATP